MKIYYLVVRTVNGKEVRGYGGEWETSLRLAIACAKQSNESAEPGEAFIVKTVRAV